ncbi:zinc ribbon domain-containing protein [Clostridium saccharobutylicum]|uniref:Zinc-ribbon domain-containing protein n=1 Tax=Clostridium saccharobutylicum TaxID=169679 RepID=A0A1S8NH53_CLOSA|nr:zinc ribbon domain-containing protein [Clostridium saccharobutylicum]OOM15799.1 hypothetical protein CLOSAC_00700 [Clostridium saccharobutylicum]
MYCEKCGKKSEEGDLYCSNCGNKLNESKYNRHGIVKGKLNAKIFVGVIVLIIIGVGSTIFFTNKLKMSENKTLSKTNSGVTQPSADDTSSDPKTQTNTENESSSSTSTQNSKNDEIASKQKNGKDAKEKFASLLQDTTWLTNNAEYKNSGSVKFLILDINQDGVPEMLLSNQSGSLASWAIYVVTYNNNNNNNVDVQKINTSHGGFAGYLSDEKVFLINGEQMGYGWGTAYKLDNNQCVQVYTWADNAGTGKELEGKINDASVSQAEYKEFTKKFQNADSNYKEFYDINTENINKYLRN